MVSKKNIKLALSFVIIVISSITSCSDDGIPREYPRVKTSDVNNITTSGATFNGEITLLGNRNIIEYGFVWDNYEFPTIDYSNKINLGSGIGLGKFTTQLETSLEKGVIYYVRAYAKTDNFLVYGKIIEFSI